MIHIHQMEVVPGNPEKNLQRIKAGIDKSTELGASLALFPENALPGYLLGDLWENNAFLQEIAEMNLEIAAYTQGKASAIWGSVQPIFEAFPILGRTHSFFTKGEDGRTRIYNAAFVAENGKFLNNGVFTGFTPKALLPKYREFDDERHFFSLLKLAQELRVQPETLLAPFDLSLNGEKTKVGVMLCEDMWDEDYAFKPTHVLKSQGAQILVNLSASPFGIGKQNKRDRILTEKSKNCEFYYVNCTGTQDNGKNIFVFDGASTIYKNTEKLTQAPSFADTILQTTSETAPENSDIELIHTGILTGIKTTLKRLGMSKVVIGLSGGLDSSVVACLCAQALGAENVTGINMPSQFNSESTKTLASQLAKNLGINYLIAPIEDSVNLTRKELENITGIPVAGLVDENIQARDRSSRILAAISAQLKAVFTNNGNKTELAQGYCTLYGDVNGVFAPIADLYKTQVFELARFINTTQNKPIPQGILDIKPSAELSANQNPENGGGDPFIFEYHDKLLYQFIEMRKSPDEILESIETIENLLGTPKKVIGGYFASTEEFLKDLEQVYTRLTTSFFKRIQAPPIITVSKRAFGFDLREFQTPVHFTRNYNRKKAALTKSTTN
jgi:NAD+ synthase (glutamine-hydrolysing)